MIVFQDDLTKYKNDKEFYNIDYLNYNKKGWKSLYNFYSKKHYKTQKKNEYKFEMIEKALKQIYKIEYLIITF
jgi:hypothetical protein